jgi:hypothetical protein
MRPSAVLGAVALFLSVLFFAGCGEEEKKAEQARLNKEIQLRVETEVSRQVAEELNRRLSGEIRSGIQIYVEDEKRKAEEAAKSAPTKSAPTPAKKPAAKKVVKP